MRKRRVIGVALLGLAGAVLAVALMLHDYARADVLGGPLPSPRLPRDAIQLTPVEKLGKLMLYDSTLSNPPGYSCAACHVPETGFTGSNSEINAFAGPQPGIVPGRFSDRKPQSYLYAAFSPEGPYSLGTKYIDYGLGANPNPAPDGTRFYKNVPGDIPEFRGLFKAPSLRGTDKRPSPDFVKAYMHNGVFKSLKDVVHFYNKRNIAVDASGKEIAFDLRKGPPSGYTPLFPPPEVLENVQNATGVAPAQATSAIESNGQVGNLQLSPQQEADLINFLKILNDGYTRPNPVSP
jgi:cytochrome c peroxidase